MILKGEKNILHDVVLLVFREGLRKKIRRKASPRARARLTTGVYGIKLNIIILSGALVAYGLQANRKQMAKDMGRNGAL